MQRWLLGGGVVLAATVAIACAGTGGAAPADSPVAVETSQMFVTVRNIAGLPLTDVTIGIKPAGVQPEYQTFYRRIESTEERAIPFGEFRGSDGTQLNLQVARPRFIHVVATDLNGKTYDVELPWE